MEGAEKGGRAGMRQPADLGARPSKTAEATGCRRVQAAHTTDDWTDLPGWDGTPATPSLLQPLFPLPQRTAAARLAILRRSCGVNASARAWPRLTARGFFGRGFVSSPVATRMTRKAISFVSVRC